MEATKVENPENALPYTEIHHEKEAATDALNKEQEVVTDALKKILSKMESKLSRQMDDQFHEIKETLYVCVLCIAMCACGFWVPLYFLFSS